MLAHLLSLVSSVPVQDLPIPNPKPSMPVQELSEFAGLAIGAAKWIALAAGMLGLIYSAGQIMAGKRGRSQFASEGIGGTLYVFLGLSVLSIVGSLLSLFVTRSG